MEELLAFIVECIGEHDLSMWWVLVRMRGTRQQLGSSVRVVTTTVVWPLPATSHMDHPSLLVICRGEPASVRPRAASSRHSCWCGHCGQQPGGAGRVQCAVFSVQCSVFSVQCVIISIKCCHQLPQPTVSQAVSLSINSSSPHFCHVIVTKVDTEFL